MFGHITIMETNLIFIKARPRVSAVKLHDVTDRQGRKLNKQKFGKKGTLLTAAYDVKRGLLKTGLDVDVDNPYYASDEAKSNAKAFTKDRSFPPEFMSVVNQPKIKRQHLLELKYGLDFNYLTSRGPGSKDRKNPFDTTFMMDFVLRLENNTTVLNLDKLNDEVGYYVALDSKRVANSERELNEHKWPEAEFYISFQQESDDIKYAKSERKMRAAALLKADYMDKIMLNKVCVVLGLTNNHKQSEQQSFNILADFIESTVSRKQGVTNVDAFIECVSKLTVAKSKTEFEYEYFLQQLIDYNVISLIKSTYRWMTQDIVLGVNKAQCLEYLMDKEQKLNLEVMKKELDIKKESL